MATDDLEAEVKARDRERWLSTLWAPAAVRQAMLAIHAYDLEQQRIVAEVREPLLAEIRLAWWRERLADLHAGKEAPAQPLLQALARAGGVDLVALSTIEDGLLPLLSEGPLDVAAMAARRGGALFGALAQAMGATAEDGGAAFALGRLARGGWGHVGARLRDVAWPDAPPAGRQPGPLAALDALGRQDVSRARSAMPPATMASAGRQWRMWWANLTA